MLFHTYQLLSSTLFKCHRWQNWQLQLVADSVTFYLHIANCIISYLPTYLHTYLSAYLPVPLYCYYLSTSSLLCPSAVVNGRIASSREVVDSSISYLWSFMPVGCLKLQNWHYSIIFLPTYGELCCYFQPTSGLLHPRTCS